MHVFLQYHSIRRRQHHRPMSLERNAEYETYVESLGRLGYSRDDLHITR